MSKIEGSIGPAGLGFGPDAQLIVQNPATASSFSLQDAIDETVADKGDVILVTRGYQAPAEDQHAGAVAGNPATL